MKVHRTNIVILLYFHLFIFTYPLVIKLSHVHGQEYNHVITDKKDHLVASKDHCFICDYEFVTFFTAKKAVYSLILPAVSIFNEHPVFKKAADPIIFFHKRGPPNFS